VILFNVTHGKLLLTMLDTDVTCICGHSLSKYDTNLNAWSSLFACSSINAWNSLPHNVVNVGTVKAFKHIIDAVDSISLP